MSARGARVPLWAMVVLVCLSLWAWGVASAEDYYVNDAATTNDGYCTAVGNDANDGLSPATPKATLQAILDAHDLGPGDTVWVDTGDYGLTTHVTIGEADEGSAAGVVRIVGSPHPDGTELDRGNTGTGTQVVLLDDCDYVTLERLRLTGANRGIYFSSANHCTLSRAVVHGNAGVGVRAFRSDAATVAHCVVRDNGDHGLNLGDCPQADIRNNSVARNGGMDDYQCKLTESSATLASNILWANGTFRYGIYTSGTTLTSDHNDLYATGGARLGYYNGTVATTLAEWQTASGQDANSLSEDPLFADAPGGDFHLRSNGGRYDPSTGKLPADPTAWVDDAASSGCVDAGNPAGDYSQEPQPNGLRINIGAYGGTDEASRMPTTQYYVNDGSTTHDQYCTAPGHNNNDGLTPATPKASLAAILSTYDLEPGDVVWVDTGTYNPSANITIGGDDEGSAAGILRIVGSPHPDGTVIQRGSTVTGSYGVELDKCNYVSLERLAVTGAYYGIYAHGDADCSVSRCTVFGNASEGVFATGSDFFSVVNSVVRDNGGYGVRLSSASAVAVHNCSIARNDDNGVYLSNSSLSLRNCIVWADGATFYAVRHASGTVTSDYNDLYATNGASVGHFGGAQATLADWQAASGQDANSLSVDPRFADAPQGDLHLVSKAGRYDPTTGLLPGDPGAWVTDGDQSVCTDNADPALPVGDEPAPNGGRANLGAYGTTDKASKMPPAVYYYVNDAATTHDQYCTAPGNDANDGLSPATPKATVQAILDTYDVEPSDIVWVDTGAYALAANIVVGSGDEGAMTRPVRLIGSPHPDGSVLDRGSTLTNSYCIELDDCDYVHIERLHLTGSKVGVRADQAHHCAVSRTVVYDNAGTGIHASSCDGFTVAHSLVRHNNGHGLFLDACPQADVRNNSLVLNGDSTTDRQCKLNAGSATLTSNILQASGSLRYCIYTSGTTLTSDYNDLYATGGARVGYYNGTIATTLAQWQAASGQDANSLSEDPLFADAPGGDFHLLSKGGRYDPTTGKLPADPTAWVDDAASSGCVDAGDPAGDYSQEPQPNGLRINIGAYGGTDEASRMPTTQYYVNDGSTTHDQYCTAPGHNNNDGLTPATPKASLGAILSTYDLEPGDVVWVDTGTYNPSANITIGGDDQGSAAGTLRIVGSPHPDGTVIQRGSTVTGSYGVELDQCDYVSLERLAVTGAYYGIYADDTGDCSVSRCTVFGNASEGVYATYSAFFTVVNTVVHDNGGYGVRLNSSSAVAVHNCSIARNDDDGVYLFDSSLSLRNSIVWADGATVYAVRRLSGSVTSDYNDLYATNGAGVGYFAGTQATLADWQTASGQDPNSLSVDPRFADAPQGDLHLVSEAGRYDPSTGLLPGEPGAWVTDAEQSPCIDAADFALPVGDEPAPNGWRANLGAYGTTDEASKISLPLALPGPLDLDTRVEVNGRRNPDGPAAKSVGVRGIDPGANGPGTRFAIKIGAGAGGWLVFGVGDAAGDLVPTGDQPLWLTADQWRDLRLRRLTPDTDYDFYAKAKNQAGQETDPTQVASHRTNRLGDVDNSESATALDYACVKDAILRGILSWPCDMDDSRSIGADDLDITASAIPLP